MFKKPSKSIRKRQDSEDEPHTENIAESDVIASFRESKKKKKTDKPALVPKAVVSFEVDEEEEEAFQVKKSSQSRKIAKQLEKERKEKELEAKFSRKVTIKPLEQESKLLDVDMPIILKGEIKPKETKQVDGRILSGREAEFAEENSDEENEEESNNISFRKPDPFRKVLQGGVIPDAATIHAMRKQRQKAREQGGDFIPLEDAEKEDTSSKSRLIREEDHDLSDDERIDFAVNLQAKEKNSRKETFIAAEAEKMSDHDDDIDDWEAQQLKKAVKKNHISMVQQETMYQQQYLGNGTTYEVRAEQIQATEYVTGSVGVEATQPVEFPASGEPLNPEMIRKRIQEKIKSLEEVHRRHQLDYEQTITDRADTLDLIEKLEKEKPELSGRYKFAQFLRGYVADLIDCLDTKMPRLETIEKGFINLLKNRNEKIVTRRRDDLRDQTDECMSQGKPVAPLPEERIRRHAEREGRRARRRRARQSYLPPEVIMLKQTTHHEGLSSDDEMPESENVIYRAERERFSIESGALFEDVVDDFSSIEGVKRNFENWRLTHMNSYRDAYVSLCLPKVFSPLIRLKLIVWNPLEEPLELEKKEWYRELLSYGWTEGETEASLKEDPDYKLTSSVVEKVIIPRVTHIVQLSYDPVSSRHTKRIVDHVRLFIDSFPTVHGNSKAFQGLVRACVEKLRDALDNDVFIPLYPKNIMDTRLASAFVQRQFWSGVKLLSNILAWEGILAEGLLRTLALDNLLTRYLILSLRSMGTAADRDLTSEVDKCRYIMRLLPNSWLNLSNPLPQLEGFVRYLVQLAQQADTTSSSGRKAVEDIASMLIRLGADDKSSEILDKYL